LIVTVHTVLQERFVAQFSEEFEQKFVDLIRPLPLSPVAATLPSSSPPSSSSS
jgi:hypothetical protein